MPSSAAELTAIEHDDLLTPENINDLARIITSEAGGVNETAQAMVGWTVINRMRKSNPTRVSEIWAHGRYTHAHFPTATSMRLAESILGGTAMDISQGATHFYTPSRMPKIGESHSGIDIGGGLETVPGVTKNGKPAQRYQPRWTTGHSAIRIPGIQEKDFKFYRLL